MGIGDIYGHGKECILLSSKCDAYILIDWIKN